jgi:Sulfotransferase family
MNQIRPIFIVGAARSGTTMLGSILGSARGCVATPESKFVTELVKGAERPAGILDPEGARSCLASNPNFRNWGVPEGEVFSCLEQPIRLCQLIERVVLTYAARRERSQVEVWLDHTPSSLFILPYLRRTFPDASLLHLIRDGRAVGASVLPLHWGPSNILEAATSWSRQVAAGLAAETSSIFEGRIRRVCYENLVSDPLTTVAGLCEFC